MDFRLSEHVLAQHNRSIRSSHNNSTTSFNRTINETLNTTTSTNLRTQAAMMIEQGITLLEHLRLKPGETIEPIGPSLLQKVTKILREIFSSSFFLCFEYIAYARRYVKPRLTREAINILKKFYFELRVAHQRNGSTPITLRQLESLMRLTEVKNVETIRNR